MTDGFTIRAIRKTDGRTIAAYLDLPTRAAAETLIAFVKEHVVAPVQFVLTGPSDDGRFKEVIE